mgnify:CR=1 FL=1
MVKNILITGFSGKLGNFVAPYLQDKGYNIVGTDIVLPNPECENAKRRIPFVKADLLNIGDLMKAIAMAQPDVIIHLGAIPFNSELQPPYDTTPKKGPSLDGVRSNYSMPEDNTMNINTMGMFYILDAARRMGVKNVIAATSYFSYGLGFRLSGEPFVPEYLPIDEEHPCWPEDTYSLSKYLGEEIMKAFTRAYDMNTVAMRLMGVYYHDMERSRAMYDLGQGQSYPETPEDGVITGNTYQYVDARDIAVFTGLAIDKLGKLPNQYEAFNVITDVRFDVPDTKEFYEKRFPTLKDKLDGLREGEGLLSIRKAEEQLGYHPQYSWKNQK